jgi:hypothetical protein
MNDQTLWGGLSSLPCRIGQKAGWKARPTKQGALHRPRAGAESFLEKEIPSFTSKSMKGTKDTKRFLGVSLPFSWCAFVDERRAKRLQVVYGSYFLLHVDDRVKDRGME